MLPMVTLAAHLAILRPFHFAFASCTRILLKMKIGLLVAGQGAQAVGMGKDLVDLYSIGAEMCARADVVLGRGLTVVMWSGPLDELTKTSNCQPALFVHGLMCLTILRELVGDFPIEAA